VPTIASADGRYTFQPFVLLQGDWGSYSKSQPLSQAGTNNLKSSGENFRRARIGFQGIFDKDFSYSFIADFGGSGGDESYQAYAAANTGTTKNASGASITPLTTSNGAGTGARLYNAWLGYKGFLDPFTFRAGVMSTPANLGGLLFQCCRLLLELLLEKIETIDVMAVFFRRVGRRLALRERGARKRNEGGACQECGFHGFHQTNSPHGSNRRRAGRKLTTFVLQ
jgi:hypothetical protein